MSDTTCKVILACIVVFVVCIVCIIAGAIISGHGGRVIYPPPQAPIMARVTCFSGPSVITWEGVLQNKPDTYYEIMVSTGRRMYLPVSACMMETP